MESYLFYYLKTIFHLDQYRPHCNDFKTFYVRSLFQYSLGLLSMGIKTVNLEFQIADTPI